MVGALELDGILRREHEERALERIGPTRGRDVHLHRFEERRLRFRRRPLISSARMICAKIGPVTNRRARCPLASSSTSVPVMSAGMRSGVN